MCSSGRPGACSDPRVFKNSSLWSMPAGPALSMRSPVAHFDAPLSYLHLSAMWQPFPGELAARSPPGSTRRGRAFGKTGRQQSGDRRGKPSGAALLPVSADLPLGNGFPLPSQRAF